MMPRSIEYIIEQKRAESETIIKINNGFKISYLKRIEELKDSTVLNPSLKERNDKQILYYYDLLMDINNETFVIEKELETFKTIIK